MWEMGSSSGCRRFLTQYRKHSPTVKRKKRSAERRCTLQNRSDQQCKKKKKKSVAGPPKFTHPDSHQKEKGRERKWKYLEIPITF